MKIPPELSDKIQAAIDEYVADPEPFLVTGDKSFPKKHNLRNTAKELNFLPMVFDWFDCWGIQSDGRVILVSFDKPSEFEVEKNQKIINMVFFDAAKEYPQLEELKPIRNKEAITCPGCDGTGICKEFFHIEKLAKAIRCNCGGVGWLPSADKKYLCF